MLMDPSRSYGRGLREQREESPSIAGHGCLLTAGGGDFKESEQKYTAAVLP